MLFSFLPWFFLPCGNSCSAYCKRKKDTRNISKLLIKFHWSFSRVVFLYFLSFFSGKSLKDKWENFEIRFGKIGRPFWEIFPQIHFLTQNFFIITNYNSLWKVNEFMLQVFPPPCSISWKNRKISRPNEIEEWKKEKVFPTNKR